MVISSSSSSSSLSVRNEATTVSLSTDLFRTAVDRYIDSNKPDPLCTKQLQAWTLEWNDGDGETPAAVVVSLNKKNNTNHTMRSTSSGSVHEEEEDTNGESSSSSYQIAGTLTIRSGSYRTVLLQVTCRWTTTSTTTTTTTTIRSLSSSNQPDHGHLYFSCHASAHIGTTTSTSVECDPTIHSKMVTRFQEDAYISKLLQNTTPTTTTTTTTVSGDDARGMILAQAEIVMTPTELEERVTVSEDVCEAIKRAIWSMADSPLDVVDLILNLPFLPTTDHAGASGSRGAGGGHFDAELKSRSTTTIPTTTLANRAKLRLLEDALCDACEKEGEGELLDELKISEKKQRR